LCKTIDGRPYDIFSVWTSPSETDLDLLSVLLSRSPRTTAPQVLNAAPTEFSTLARVPYAPSKATQLLPLGARKQRYDSVALTRELYLETNTKFTCMCPAPPPAIKRPRREAPPRLSGLAQPCAVFSRLAAVVCMIARMIQKGAFIRDEQRSADVGVQDKDLPRYFSTG
jgi:hypothetical protein